MLDFHLSVQPKTEQRLKIILNSIEDEENFSQSIINDQIARLQRSIFNFLNPNYLGKEAQFRKSFEILIQKENNETQSTVLKKLVQPFILRRVKTDKQIIKDLPDKIEHQQYCNLTKEQASLYEDEAQTNL